MEAAILGSLALDVSAFYNLRELPFELTPSKSSS
jgi:hypothetical protein